MCHYGYDDPRSIYSKESQAKAAEEIISTHFEKELHEKLEEMEIIMRFRCRLDVEDW